MTLLDVEFPSVQLMSGTPPTPINGFLKFCRFASYGVKMCILNSFIFLTDVSIDVLFENEN